MTNEDVLKISGTWTLLNKHINEITEDQLKLMINHSVMLGRNGNNLERIHQRYSKLRTARERESIMKGNML
jgi:hypothetical protein